MTEFVPIPFSKTAMPNLQIYLGDRFTSRFCVYGSEHAAQGTIVLLHGLFENCTVWDGFTTPFASVLGQSFRVVAIDLLGHNPDTPIPFDTPVTLRLMADEVMTILRSLNIETALFVGHSMGGAVVMQCLQHYAARVQGLCLFHATPFADADDARVARNTTIARIRAGEKDDIAETLLKRIITESSWESVGSENIERLRTILRQTPESGMVAGHEAMRDREDTQHILENTPCPVLFLLGKNDPIINIDTMLPLAKLPQTAHVSLLSGVAHAGMVEAPNLSVSLLQGFAYSVFATTDRRS